MHTNGSNGVLHGGILTLTLQGIQSSHVFQRRCGNRALVRFEEIKELVLCMGPAGKFDHATLGEQGLVTCVIIYHEMTAPISPLPVLSWIAGGLGLALLSQSTLSLDPSQKEIAILNVEGFPIRRSWYVVRLRDKQLSIVAGTFLDFLRTHVQLLAPRH